MTARRRPLASSVALLIVLLVGVLPASAAAVGLPTGPVLGAVRHHHVTMPGIVRAETVTQDLHAEAALQTAALAGLALLAWAARRPVKLAAQPAMLPVPGGRDPPRAD